MFSNSITNMFENFGMLDALFGAGETQSLHYGKIDSDGALVLEYITPGIAKSDLKLTVAESGDLRYRVSLSVKDVVKSSISINKNYDIDTATSTYNNGLLVVKFPKKATEKSGIRILDIK
jgi:HSP20 family molecular chaperone IbpA